MFNIGPLELIIIFIAALLVIGPKKLPGVARALGRAIGEFKKASEEFRSNLDIDLNVTDDDLTPSNISSSKKYENEKHTLKNDKKASTEEKNLNDR